MAEDADILKGLYGLRLDAPGLAELLIVLGLGLAVAAIFCALLRLFRRRVRPVSVADQLAACRSLPRAERLTALAALLLELTDRAAPGPDPWTGRAETLGVAPGLLGDLRVALYRPDPDLNTDDLEHAVLRAARRAGA